MNPADNKKQNELLLRATAERHIDATQQVKHPLAAESPAPPLDDLLHELQVHQVELEMQNEALRQKQTELEASRNRYVDLYDFAPVGYLTLTVDGMIDEINFTAVKLLRAERKDLLHRGFISLVVAEDQNRWVSLVPRLKAMDSKDCVEVAMRRGDGTVLQAQLDCAPQKTGDGGRAMRIALIDITERKQAEAASKENLARYLAVTQSASDAIVTMDSAGNIAGWNAASERLFGHTEAEATGQALTMIVPQHFRQRHQEGMQKRFADGAPPLGGKLVEVQGLRKDGSKFPLELLIAGWSTSQGKFFTGIMRDITERKQAEDEIRSLNANLEERVSQRTAELETAYQALALAKDAAEAANIAKSAFLANMSHEIRTPMNGIVGMANILRREGITPQQAKRLDTIDTSAQHLLSVINNILDLSKIEAGKFVLEEAPVAISSLLANISSILSERAKAKGIHLLTQTESLPSNLLGDPVRLQQALLNYAANAVKFSEKGTVTLRTVKQEETADEVVVRFEVEDAGIGIPPETLSRLFSAFEQADNSMTRKYGGTGLGLAITRRLAELMGGEVGADSTEGVGSTFWFTVRLKKGAVLVATPAATEADAETLIRQRYVRRRILVVDDEPINREVAEMQLEAVDLIVDSAEDGAEAVTLAQERSYAAIFMDMQMPKVNGVEATKQIRQLPGYRDTPIIAMTANVFTEDKAECLAAGMNDFLIKPFNPDQLFAILLRSLSRQDV